MRSWKQTDRQQLLMESSLAYPRGKEEKRRNSKKRQNSKGEQTLGYLGVVIPVTSKEDVPLRGEDNGIDIHKIVSIATDGARSMTGIHKGVTSILQKNK
ncbi:hypothetical protein AVEN_105348-1 [Araneus ventricosus]|uniref:DUF4371 domain-containing protein n=1 Tax=Araneus ventricosus TaxID=182803 RepID=A0A4Y2W8P2_ARAVE|nr:hypothetical protein AVEN_105348-1 [Araneus ventricosus]